MGRTLYDGTNRMFRILPNDQRATGEDEHLHISQLRFLVKYQKNASQPTERLFFPDGQPITLYTTPKQKKVSMVVCIQRIFFKAGNRSAIVTAYILSQPKAAIRRRQ